MPRLIVGSFGISIDGYAAWHGGWGLNPSYHVPVFVLTQRPAAGSDSNRTTR